jgi:predicted ATPase/class 3 adenylate cyclase
MSTAPTGTVTFLFTDMVGSTRLWEKLPQEMQEVVQRHDRLMRETMEVGGGHVFKTVGDAFCVAFATPREALHAAVAAQARLRETDWGAVGPIKVRMGLHSGTAEYRDADYFGGTLNRVARIESAAHGGQILMSQATRELLEDFLPDGVTLRALGRHRLRNLDRPEHLFEVVLRGWDEVFPPPRTLEVLPSNLPLQMTSFIGRERELDQVQRGVEAGRLWTLVGTGGTGKTRLAQEVAARLTPHFSDGVWQVELALMEEPSRVGEALIGALGIRGESGRSGQEVLLGYLGIKHLLLLLDNCEHLQAEVVRWAALILRHCPRVHLLATSRQRLGVAGERTFPVLPLGTTEEPSSGSTPRDLVALLAEDESARLFVDRARAVRPDFAVTSANAPALLQICRRLDGLPLAIELAAARVQVLDLEQIAARLKDRFRLLRTDGSAHLPHQRTLESLIGWSYDLLSEEEKILFRRLGVFIGGRTLSAVEGVCSGDGLEEDDILDRLQQLVDKSLVTLESHPELGVRYTLSESVWHFARARLRASSEESVLRERHAGHFLAFAEIASEHLAGPRQKEWLEQCQAEVFNLRQAWEWCLRGRQVEWGMRLMGALSRYFEVRGPMEEAWTVLGQLDVLPSEAVSLQVQSGFQLTFGRICWALDRYEEARQHYLKAGVMFEQQGDVVGMARVEALHSFLDRSQGLLDRAEERLVQVVDVGRSHGKESLEAMGLSGLASVAMERGDLTRARELKEEALARLHHLGDRWLCGLALWGLVHVVVAQKDLARAQSALAEWYAIVGSLGNRWVIPFILDLQAEVALLRGEPVRAARLLGAAEQWRTYFNEPLKGLDKEHFEDLTKRMALHLDDDQVRMAWEAGRRASPWELLGEGVP